MRQTNIRSHRRRIKNGSTRVKKHSRKVKDIMHKKGVYIPPAWTDVKVHKGKNYIITGVDCQGKTQYIYKPEFVQTQQRGKFERINLLEKDKGLIKEIVAELGDSDEARAAYTMYATGIRPGGRGQLGVKKAYGVIDLKPSQVKVKGSEVKFDFVGKKGVPIKVGVRDKRLVKVVKGKNGKLLFKTTPCKVRAYLGRKGDIRMKDLRTLRAQKIARKDPKQAVQRVAEALGNTPKVAKDAYINPVLIT